MFDNFLKSRPTGISHRTVEAYHYTLDRFVRYPLIPEGINQYLNDLACGNGKLKFYSCLRALCNWLHNSGYIPDNPIKKISPPKTSKKLLPAITDEQLATILNHCRCERDKALTTLLWYSGMRVAEIANVKAADFNWEEGTVVILGKSNKYRKALAGNGVVKEWFKDHDTFEISRGGIQTMLKRMAKDTGIRCNAHSFRRGFCLHNLKSGLSTRVVQTLGGWEQISMVEHYSKSLTFNDVLSMYQKINGN